MTFTEKKSTKRRLAAVMVWVFLLTNLFPPGISAADMGAPWGGTVDSKLLAHNPFGLQIAEELGAVSGFHQGNRNLPVVIHLADAHGNPSAQQKTAGLILSLIQQNKTSAGRKNFFYVLTEGASGYVTRAPLAAFKRTGVDPKQSLLARGVISGPEIAALEDEQIILLGMEDQKLYEANRSAWEEAQALMAANLEYLHAYEEKTRRILWSGASRELTDLLRLEEEMGREDADWTSVARGLAEFVRLDRRHQNRPINGKPLNVSDLAENFPQIFRLLQLEFLWRTARSELEALQAERMQESQTSFSIQKEPSHKRADESAPAETEDESLAQAVAADWQAVPDAAEFAELPPEIQGEREFEPGWSSVVRDVFEPANVRKTTDAAKKYLRTSQDLDGYQLYNEAGRLIRRLKKIYYGDPAAVRADSLYSRIQALKRLASLKMTSAEAVRWISQSNFDAASIEGDYQKAAGEASGISSAFNAEACMRYYKLALQRDKVFFENTQTFMRSHPEEPFIFLFTGGFHAAGLAHELRHSQNSYLLLRPQIDKVEEADERRYRAAMDWSESALMARTALSHQPQSAVREMARRFIEQKGSLAGLEAAFETELREVSFPQMQALNLNEPAFRLDRLRAVFYPALEAAAGTQLRSEVRSFPPVPAGYESGRSEQLGGYALQTYNLDGREARDWIRFFLDRDGFTYTLSVVIDFADPEAPWSYVEVRRAPQQSFRPDEYLQHEKLTGIRYRGRILETVEKGRRPGEGPGFKVESFAPLVAPLILSGLLPDNFSEIEWSFRAKNVFYPQKVKLPAEGLPVWINLGVRESVFLDDSAAPDSTPVRDGDSVSSVAPPAVLAEEFRAYDPMTKWRALREALKDRLNYFSSAGGETIQQQENPDYVGAVIFNENMGTLWLMEMIDIRKGNTLSFPSVNLVSADEVFITGEGDDVKLVLRVPGAAPDGRTLYTVMSVAGAPAADVNEEKLESLLKGQEIEPLNMARYRRAADALEFNRLSPENKWNVIRKTFSYRNWEQDKSTFVRLGDDKLRQPRAARQDGKGYVLQLSYDAAEPNVIRMENTFRGERHASSMPLEGIDLRLLDSVWRTEDKNGKPLHVLLTRSKQKYFAHNIPVEGEARFYIPVENLEKFIADNGLRAVNAGIFLNESREQSLERLLTREINITPLIKNLPDKQFPNIESFLQQPLFGPVTSEDFGDPRRAWVRSDGAGYVFMDYDMQIRNWESRYTSYSFRLDLIPRRYLLVLSRNPQRTISSVSVMRLRDGKTIPGAEFPLEWVTQAVIRPPKAAFSDKTEIQLELQPLTGGMEERLNAFIRAIAQQTDKDVDQVSTYMNSGLFTYENDSVRLMIRAPVPAGPRMIDTSGDTETEPMRPFDPELPESETERSAREAMLQFLESSPVNSIEYAAYALLKRLLAEGSSSAYRKSLLNPKNVNELIQDARLNPEPYEYDAAFWAALFIELPGILKGFQVLPRGLIEFYRVFSEHPEVRPYLEGTRVYTIWQPYLEPDAAPAEKAAPRKDVRPEPAAKAPRAIPQVKKDVPLNPTINGFFRWLGKKDPGFAKNKVSQNELRNLIEEFERVVSGKIPREQLRQIVRSQLQDAKELGTQRLEAFLDSFGVRSEVRNTSKLPADYEAGAVQALGGYRMQKFTRGGKPVRDQIDFIFERRDVRLTLAVSTDYSDPDTLRSSVQIFRSPLSEFNPENPRSGTVLADVSFLGRILDQVDAARVGGQPGITAIAADALRGLLRQAGIMDAAEISDRWISTLADIYVKVEPSDKLPKKGLALQLNFIPGPEAESSSGTGDSGLRAALTGLLNVDITPLLDTAHELSDPVLTGLASEEVLAGSFFELYAGSALETESSFRGGQNRQIMDVNLRVRDKEGSLARLSFEQRTLFGEPVVRSYVLTIPLNPSVSFNLSREEVDLFMLGDAGLAQGVALSGQAFPVTQREAVKSLRYTGPQESSIGKKEWTVTLNEMNDDTRLKLEPLREALRSKGFQGMIGFNEAGSEWALEGNDFKLIISAYEAEPAANPEDLAPAEERGTEQPLIQGAAAFSTVTMDFAAFLGAVDGFARNWKGSSFDDLLEVLKNLYRQEPVDMTFRPGTPVAILDHEGQLTDRASSEVFANLYFPRVEAGDEPSRFYTLSLPLRTALRVVINPEDISFEAIVSDGKARGTASQKLLSVTGRSAVENVRYTSALQSDSGKKEWVITFHQINGEMRENLEEVRRKLQEYGFEDVAVSLEQPGGRWILEGDSFKLTFMPAESAAEAQTPKTDPLPAETPSQPSSVIPPSTTPQDLLGRPLPDSVALVEGLMDFTVFTKYVDVNMRNAVMLLRKILNKNSEDPRDWASVHVKLAKDVSVDFSDVTFSEPSSRKKHLDLEAKTDRNSLTPWTASFVRVLDSNKNTLTLRNDLPKKKGILMDEYDKAVLPIRPADLTQVLFGLEVPYDRNSKAQLRLTVSRWNDEDLAAFINAARRAGGRVSRRGGEGGEVINFAFPDLHIRIRNISIRSTGLEREKPESSEAADARNPWVQLSGNALEFAGFARQTAPLDAEMSGALFRTLQDFFGSADTAKNYTAEFVGVTDASTGIVNEEYLRIQPLSAAAGPVFPGDWAVIRRSSGEPSEAVLLVNAKALEPGGNEKFRFILSVTAGSNSPLLIELLPGKRTLIQRLSFLPASARIAIPRENILSLQVRRGTGQNPARRSILLRVNDWNDGQGDLFAAEAKRQGGIVEESSDQRLTVVFEEFDLTIQKTTVVELPASPGAPTQSPVNAGLSEEVPTIKQFEVGSAELQAQILSSEFSGPMMMGRWEGAGHDDFRLTAVSSASPLRTGVDDSFMEILKQVVRVGDTLYLLIDTSGFSREALESMRSNDGVAEGRVQFDDKTLIWKIISMEEAQSRNGYRVYRSIFEYESSLPQASPAKTSVNTALSAALPSVKQFDVGSLELEAQILASGFVKGPVPGAGERFSQYYYRASGERGFNEQRFISFIEQFRRVMDQNGWEANERADFRFKAVDSAFMERAGVDDGLMPILKQVARVNGVLYLLIDTSGEFGRDALEIMRSKEGVAEGEVRFENETLAWKMVSTEEAQSVEGYKDYQDIFEYEVSSDLKDSKRNSGLSKYRQAVEASGSGDVTRVFQPNLPFDERLQALENVLRGTGALITPVSNSESDWPSQGVSVTYPEDIENSFRFEFTRDNRPSDTAFYAAATHDAFGKNSYAVQLIAARGQFGKNIILALDRPEINRDAEPVMASLLFEPDDVRSVVINRRPYRNNFRKELSVKISRWKAEELDAFVQDLQGIVGGEVRRFDGSGSTRVVASFPSLLLDIIFGPKEETSDLTSKFFPVNRNTPATPGWVGEFLKQMGSEGWIFELNSVYRTYRHAATEYFMTEDSRESEWGIRFPGMRVSVYWGSQPPNIGGVYGVKNTMEWRVHFPDVRGLRLDDFNAKPTLTLVMQPDRYGAYRDAVQAILTKDADVITRDYFEITEDRIVLLGEDGQGVELDFRGLAKTAGNLESAENSGNLPDQKTGEQMTRGFLKEEPPASESLTSLSGKPVSRSWDSFQLSDRILLDPEKSDTWLDELFLFSKRAESDWKKESGKPAYSIKISDTNVYRLSAENGSLAIQFSGMTLNLSGVVANITAFRDAQTNFDFAWTFPVEDMDAIALGNTEGDRGPVVFLYLSPDFFEEYRRLLPEFIQRLAGGDMPSRYLQVGGNWIEFKDDQNQEGRLVFVFGETPENWPGEQNDPGVRGAAAEETVRLLTQLDVYLQAQGARPLTAAMLAGYLEDFETVSWNRALSAGDVRSIVRAINNPSSGQAYSLRQRLETETQVEDFSSRVMQLLVSAREARSEVRTALSVPDDYEAREKMNTKGLRIVEYFRANEKVREMLQFYFLVEEEVLTLTLVEDFSDRSKMRSAIEVRRIAVKDFDSADPEGGTSILNKLYRGQLFSRFEAAKIDNLPGVQMQISGDVRDLLIDAGLAKDNLKGAFWTGRLISAADNARPFKLGLAVQFNFTGDETPVPAAENPAEAPVPDAAQIVSDAFDLTGARDISAALQQIGKREMIVEELLPLFEGTNLTEVRFPARQPEAAMRKLMPDADPVPVRVLSGNNSILFDDADRTQGVLFYVPDANSGNAPLNIARRERVVVEGETREVELKFYIYSMKGVGREWKTDVYLTVRDNKISKQGASPGFYPFIPPATIESMHVKAEPGSGEQIYLMTLKDVTRKTIEEMKKTAGHAFWTESKKAGFSAEYVENKGLVFRLNGLQLVFRLPPAEEAASDSAEATTPDRSAKLVSTVIPKGALNLLALREKVQAAEARSASNLFPYQEIFGVEPASNANLPNGYFSLPNDPSVIMQYEADSGSKMRFFWLYDEKLLENKSVSWPLTEQNVSLFSTYASSSRKVVLNSPGGQSATKSWEFIADEISDAEGKLYLKFVLPEVAVVSLSSYENLNTIYFVPASRSDSGKTEYYVEIKNLEETVVKELDRLKTQYEASETPGRVFWDENGAYVIDHPEAKLFLSVRPQTAASTEEITTEDVLPGALAGVKTTDPGVQEQYLSVVRALPEPDGAQFGVYLKALFEAERNPEVFEQMLSEEEIAAWIKRIRYVNITGEDYVTLVHMLLGGSDSEEVNAALIPETVRRWIYAMIDDDSLKERFDMTHMRERVDEVFFPERKKAKEPFESEDVPLNPVLPEPVRIDDPEDVILQPVDLEETLDSDYSEGSGSAALSAGEPLKTDEPRLRIEWWNNALQNVFGPVIDRLQSPDLTEEERSEIVTMETVERLIKQAEAGPDFDADQFPTFIFTIERASRMQGIAVTEATADFLELYGQVPENIARLATTRINVLLEWLLTEARLEPKGAKPLYFVRTWLLQRKNVISSQELADLLIEYEKSKTQIDRDTLADLIQNMNASREVLWLAGAPFTEEIVEDITSTTWSRILASRSEVRASAPENPLEPLVQYAVRELQYAEAGGFVTTAAIDSPDAVSQFADSYEVPSVSRVRVVSNPVMRPGDNMLLHYETERILTPLDPQAFQAADLPLPVLRRETAQGTELWVREGLWHSYLNAERSGKADLWRQYSGEVFKTILRTQENRLQQAFGRIEKATGNRKLLVLVTPEVIRKNYGFARSVELLGSLGHQVVILEDETLRKETRAQFYKDYALQGQLGQTVFSVTADAPALKMRLAEIRGGEVKPRDVVVLGFENESLPELSPEAARLVLEEEVLSFDAGRRADYPVAFLAAEILLRPSEIEKLGEEIISRIAQYGWQLHQTPDAGSIHEALRFEMETYQALSQAA